MHPAWLFIWVSGMRQAHGWLLTSEQGAAGSGPCEGQARGLGGEMPLLQGPGVPQRASVQIWGARPLVETGWGLSAAAEMRRGRLLPSSPQPCSPGHVGAGLLWEALWTVPELSPRLVGKQVNLVASKSFEEPRLVSPPSCWKGQPSRTPGPAEIPRSPPPSRTMV